MPEHNTHCAFVKGADHEGTLKAAILSVSSLRYNEFTRQGFLVKNKGTKREMLDFIDDKYPSAEIINEHDLD